jgi:hypothetical protein
MWFTSLALRILSCPRDVIRALFLGLKTQFLAPGLHEGARCLKRVGNDYVKRASDGEHRKVPCALDYSPKCILTWQVPYHGPARTNKEAYIVR